MAKNKKKKSDESTSKPDEVRSSIDELMDNTDFRQSSDTSILTGAQKTPTPIEVLNILLGGGLPLGMVAQSWGPPGGGKSTWLYQSMALFQERFPDGLGIIIDVESSADAERIGYLGVQLDRVLRLPSASIKSGFTNLIQVIKNKENNDSLKEMPVFVIWDTISKAKAEDESVQSRMSAMDRARIIKNYMAELLPLIEKHHMFLGLLNQVIYYDKGYGYQGEKAGGGISLKHDLHFSTYIKSEKSEYEGPFIKTVVSNMDVDKSKISPIMHNIPIVLDVSQGGRIDTVRSFVDYCCNIELIEQSKGWYNFAPVLKRYEGTPYCGYLSNKSYRYHDLVEAFRENTELYEMFVVFIGNLIGSIYYLQKGIIDEYIVPIDKKYNPDIYEKE